MRRSTSRPMQRLHFSDRHPATVLTAIGRRWSAVAQLQPAFLDASDQIVARAGPSDTRRGRTPRCCGAAPGLRRAGATSRPSAISALAAWTGSMRQMVGFGHQRFQQGHRSANRDLRRRADVQRAHHMVQHGMRSARCGRNPRKLHKVAARTDRAICMQRVSGRAMTRRTIAEQHLLAQPVQHVEHFGKADDKIEIPPQKAGQKIELRVFDDLQRALAGAGRASGSSPWE